MTSRDNPSIVPLPREWRRASGELNTDSLRSIRVNSADLLPLARILQKEIGLITGAQPGVSEHGPALGGITLEINAGMPEDEYLLEIGDHVSIKGGSYRAVSWGSVSVEQLIEIRQNSVVLPHITINDRPYAEYRALMVDLARQWHPIEVVRECVELCRWCKIGYLQLHFTDDQSWTLPSELYPGLPTPGRHYSLEEMGDLEQFACTRGVTIIPEIDVPGHSQSLVDALPDLVATSTRSSNVISPGRESTYEVIGALIGEVCDIFRTTPYFHIGADEVNKTGWAVCEFCTVYKNERGIADDEELYRHFIVRMNDIVRSHGKQAIVWEGFKADGSIRIPTDMIVIGWESYYEIAPRLLAEGYLLINASWQPLYVTLNKSWTPEEIFSWNMYRWEHFWEESKAYPDGIEVPPTPRVIGGQMCSWEQASDVEIPSLRRRLATFGERLWSHDRAGSFAEFSGRLNHTDDRLERLLDAKPHAQLQQ